MRVLYRCEEDNTLCITESVGVYREGDATFIRLPDTDCERVCYDIVERMYEACLKGAVETGGVDFSEYSFGMKEKEEESPWSNCEERDPDCYF